MPKCARCGRKFQTISALNDHYRAVHPNERFYIPKKNTSRNLATVVLAIVVISSLVGIIVYTQSQTSNQSTTFTTADVSILNQPIPNALYNEITGVSTSTLSSVGKGSATTSVVRTVNGSPLTSGGKPEFLYIGADYCPYCAVERWAIAIALSKFGTISGMAYMLSGSSDGNIATVTFSNITYSSVYLVFQAVEIADRSGKPLQTLTSNEEGIFVQYDSSRSIPFVDIYNKYVIVGAQPPVASVSSNIFTGLSWSQIGSELDKPTSAIAKAIDGSANYIISMICSIDGKEPSNICRQSFSQIPILIVSSPFNQGASSVQLTWPLPKATRID